MSGVQRRDLSVKISASRVQSPASRFQGPETSVQIPASNSCVQSPGIPVCPLSFNLSIRILILSWPWALLGSNFRITFKISFSENLTVLKHVFVCGKSWGGIWLSFFKREHCLAKTELKILLFTWKLVTNSSSWSMGGMQGIFYRWKNVLESSNNIFH